LNGCLNDNHSTIRYRIIFLKTKDWLAFILLGLVWGSSFLWIKLAVREIGPFLLVALRLLFGIATLLVAASLARPAWPRARSVWLSLTFLGIINNAIPYTLISWGEQYIDSAVAAILNSSTPLFTMLVAHFLLSDDRITRTSLLGLLMGFAGIIILFTGDQGLGFGGSLLGKLAVLLAAVSYSFASVYARRTTQGLSPVIQALIPLLGADLILWGMAPLVEAPLTLPRLPLTWLSIAWLGVFLHSVGPTRTVLVTYVFPLVGVALGVIFLGERLEWRLLAGAALVVGSIAVVNRRA
jgi:drug/metabolite transporter (DMT)-like permease